MNKPKISIIVPVYNAAPYLPQCLDSILDQSFSEIQVICVNDGSTDSSLEILESYQKQDHRIQIISKKNDGLGAARNSGLELAIGEYIGYVDSDDFIDEDMFYELYQTAVRTNADVTLGNVYLYYNDTDERKPFRNQALYRNFQQQSPFRAEEFPHIIENIGVWDKLYRRDFVIQHKLRNPEHVIYEDALFTFQSLIYANQISVCCNAIYYYRKNTGHAITDAEIWNDNYKFDFLYNSIAIKEFLIQENVYEIFATPFLNYFFKNALWHQSNFSDYKKFKIFFQKVQSFIDKEDFYYFYQNEFISWKVHLYSHILLRLHPYFSYIFFLYKRIKRGKING